METKRDCNAVELYVNESFPYWRVVSQRGYLIDNIYCSKDTQKEKLEAEGVKVDQIGEKYSYRVNEFANHRFDVNCFRITVMKTDKELFELFEKYSDRVEHPYHR